MGGGRRGPRGDVGEGLLRLLSGSLLARLAPDGEELSEGRWDECRAVASACRQLAQLAGERGRIDLATDLLDAALRIDRAVPGEIPVRETQASLRGYVEVLERRIADDPRDGVLLRQVAWAHSRLAELDRDEGQLALADAGHRRAIEALTARLELDPDNAAYRHEVATAHVRLADLNAAAGWAAQAESGYARARQVLQESVRAERPPGRVR